MWRFVVLVGLLTVTTACESGVTTDVVFIVPADVAAAYDTTSPGVLQTSLQSELAPVCGGELTVHYYTDWLGCLRDEEPMDTVDAWIVPAPASWDGLCDVAFDPEEPALTLDAAEFPVADLPARSEADPAGSVEADWKKESICGGRLETEVTLAAPN